jgi:hypothetical protein
MRALLILPILVLCSAGVNAQEAAVVEPASQAVTPAGEWRDDFGTTLQLSLCGDGTQLCGVLLDVQGESRTDKNLAFVNQQIMQADMTAPNKWQGQVVYNGGKAASTITQVAADTIEIQGCQFAVLCQTIPFYRL